MAYSGGQDSSAGQLCQFCPPLDPPKEQDGTWELQYCKLYGWAWVKKCDKNSPPPSPPVQTRSTAPPERKKRCGLCKCFKKNREDKKPLQKTASGRPMTKSLTTSEDSQKRAKPHGEDECCCCCCNDVNGNESCPCILLYCTCNNTDQNQNEMGTWSEDKCMCKNVETQTHTHLKDTSTAMSKVHLSKGKSCRCHGKRVVCVRAVCCPCSHNIGCPCVQNSNPTGPTNKPEITCGANTANTSNDNASVEKLVNLCLTNNLCKPNLNTFFNKSSDNPAIHKSLDILLKNNANIMHMINENKELKKESKTPNFLDLNHSISCLSLDNSIKKSDDEHCKLLTAVCDAILSSHKFENEGRKNASSTSMGRASLNPLDIFKTTGNLERTLNHLNFSTQKIGSTDQCNVRKEIGVQVNNNPVKKSDRSLCSSKLAGKLSKSRNRSSQIPRAHRRSDTIKNMGLIKMNFKNDATATSPSNGSNAGDIQKNECSFRNDDQNTLGSFKCENVSHGIFLPLNFSPQNPGTTVENKATTLRQSQTLEQMLASVNFNFKNPACNNSVRHHQDRPNIHLLEATSPPFADYEPPFFVENSKDERNSDYGKTHFRR